MVVQLQKPKSDRRRVSVELGDILKPGSKSRWLLSETLVVVLGVLIALGLNDYWTYRQERVLELQYVRRIHADVSVDIERIDQFITDFLVRKLQALDAIAPVVRGEEPVPEDLESFLMNVSLGAIGGASSTRWVTTTTFEDLISTGNLRLIRDSDLRRKIARYYEEFDEIHLRSRDRRTGYAKFVSSQLPGELREELNLAAMEKFGIDRAVESFRSIEFQNLLNQEYNSAIFKKGFDSSLSERLAKDLENYIQQLEADN